MERLKAAVGKAPAQQQRDVRQAQQAASPAERARFGINNLLNRMTGHAGEAQQPPREAPPLRQQAQVRTVAEEPEPDPEQEKIEIPAFLRRQAN
jgi:cell division protein FtsZ